MNKKKSYFKEKEEIFKNYLKIAEFASREAFRIESSIDIDIDDQLKKKIHLNSDINYISEVQIYIISKSDYPKNLSETIFLIKRSPGGLCIRNFLNSYIGIKNDLINMATYSGKYRKIIILNGNIDHQLTVFPFEKENWIFISNETIKLWHFL